MDERCKTCKWWDRQAAGSMALDVGKCALTRNDYDQDNRAHAESLAWAVVEDAVEDATDIGLSAALVTRPDFGCVQWEAKEVS